MNYSCFVCLEEGGGGGLVCFIGWIFFKKNG